MWGFFLTTKTSLVINSKYRGTHMSIPNRSGAMGSIEVLTGNIEFFTLFTKLDISVTGDYNDDSQKDFESVVQVIGLRAMPAVMNNPVYLNGIGNNLLENYGASTITGSGYIFKFATEMPGAHTVQTLIDELHGIVLNSGIVDTKDVVNTEFTKQDLL